MYVRRAFAVLPLVLAIAGCGRSPATARVFVTNEDSGNVTIIDAAKDEVVGNIWLGRRARGVRVSRDGTKLFVAVSGPPVAVAPPVSVVHADAPVITDTDAPVSSGEGIAVVDLATRRVLRTLPAGRDPESFDMTADGRTFYVSNDETAEVTTVDADAGKVTATTKVGAAPEGVALSPDSEYVYVATESGNELDILGARSGNIVARVPTQMRPRGVVFSADGREAFVSAERDGVMNVIDTKTRAIVGAIATGGVEAKPMGIAISPDGRHAYVTNGHEGSVAFIDLVARRLERTVPAVGDRPWGIAITPDGKKLFVAAAPDVAIIDIVSGKVSARVAVGAGPWGVAAGH